MKKLILSALIVSAVFATSNDDINKKLDLLLQKIEQLEKKVEKKDSEIEKLKKELKKQQQEIKKQEQTTQKKFAVKSCNKLKVVSFNYEYHNDVIPYYDLTIKMKNEYPFTVTFIRGSLYAEDKDKVKILQDYIERNVNIKPNETITIKKKHILTGELEKYLKDEKPENLKVYFKPTRVEFKDGEKVECFN
jgi:low affinity Fe/Cu permease